MRRFCDASRFPFPIVEVICSTHYATNNVRCRVLVDQSFVTTCNQACVPTRPARSLIACVPRCSENLVGLRRSSTRGLPAMDDCLQPEEVTSARRRRT